MVIVTRSQEPADPVRRQEPVEEGGEVEKACMNCRVLWPEDALDSQTGFCPDCKEKEPPPSELD
jgi:hypothetical protein